MSEKNLQKKIDEKELEINALLEITQAVNNNLPEEDLYKIYEFILRANLFITRLALYVLEDHWECKVQFGTTQNFSKVRLDQKCFSIQEITKISENIMEFGLKNGKKYQFVQDFVFNEADLRKCLINFKSTIHLNLDLSSS